MKTSHFILNKGLLVGFLSVGLICAGCSAKKAALEKISRADQAIGQANQKNVATYAPLEISMAQNKLGEAKKAEDDGKHKKAGRLAEESIVNAELAESKLASAKMQENTEETRKSMDALKQETRRSRDKSISREE